MIALDLFLNKEVYRFTIYIIRKEVCTNSQTAKHDKDLEILRN
jgi:hypothetical protein